jgi:osmotically-inducible protein OsmY/uncharacterized protein YrrD
MTTEVEELHQVATLPIGAPVACRDGRLGHLERVLIEPASRKVRYLVVATGWPRHHDVLVPIALVDPITRTDDEIILRMDRASFEQMARYANRTGEVREIGTSRAVEHATRVWCDDSGPVGTVEAVRFDPTTDDLAGIVVQTGLIRHAHRRVPAVWLGHFDPETVEVRMPVAAFEQLGTARPDAELLADVAAHLKEDRTTRALVLHETDVDVADGIVTLRGRVRSRTAARRLAERAAQVPGVQAVQDRMVADDELELAVAAAIGRGELSRDARLHLRVADGRVQVGGAFPSQAAYQEAVRLAAGVPGVVEAVAFEPLM